MVTEVNAIFEQKDMPYVCEIAVLSGPIAGLQHGESHAKVKVKTLQNGNTWMISKEDFINRRYMLQRKMQVEEESDDEDADEKNPNQEIHREASEMALNVDPFEFADDEVIIGAATCFVQSLCYNIEFDDQINIVDYKGRTEGKIEVAVHPC